MYTDHYKDGAKKVAGDDDFIVIQFSGGQAPAGFNAQNAYVSNDPTRNYHPFFVQKVIDLIKEKHEDLKILNFSLPNEPKYEETEQPELMPFAQWHEILKLPNCKGFISTDSCLSHFARSAGRKGVVFGVVQGGHNSVINRIGTSINGGLNGMNGIMKNLNHKIQEISW